MNNQKATYAVDLKQRAQEQQMMNPQSRPYGSGMNPQSRQYGGGSMFHEQQQRNDSESQTKMIDTSGSSSIQNPQSRKPSA